jgi:hypothetical protein
VATLLRTHFEAGRLTFEEFEERLERVYRAKTLGDLDALTADLPAEQRPRTSREDRRRRRVAAQVRAYVLVMLFLIAIWAVTGHGYFWPIWPMLGWGLGIAFMVLGGGGPGPNRPDREARRTARSQRRQDRYERRHGSDDR